MAVRRGANDMNIERVDLGGLKDLSLLQRSDLPRRIVDRPYSVATTPSTQNFIFGGNRQFDEKERILSDEVGPARLTHMWGKVCFGFFCYTDDGLNNCYIYVVDLNDDDSDEWSFRAPTICFNWDNFLFDAFCVLDDILYMFQMTDPNEEHRCGRRVWKYKLPLSLETANRKLEERDLVKVASTNYPKRSPLATSTPDGKILVLSTRIVFFSKSNSEERDFELYDPHKELWEELPGLSSDEWHFKRCDIHAFAFLNNEPVLVLRTSQGMFSLDLRPSDDDRHWKRFVPSGGDLNGSLPPHREPQFILVGDNLCLTNSGAFDLVGKTPLLFKYPQLPYHRSSRAHRSAVIPLHSLTIKNRGCFFCVMDAQIDSGTNIPRIAVNLYRFDYIKFNEDLEKEKMEGRLLPGTKVLKMFKFLLRPLTDREFFPIFVSYIPRATVELQGEEGS